MKDFTNASVVEIDDEIFRLEDELEKAPNVDTYRRMKELMILSNSKSADKNKWNVK